MICSYCGTARAVTVDHVVHKFRFKRAGFAEKVGFAVNAPENRVPACFDCNMRKGTLRLVPKSHAHLIPTLNKLGRVPWRVWNGGKLPKVIA